jgi:N-acetylglucosaminyldiphosphoundecaprenol N-acetyl-beta-D-mannosaminyltransferase
MSSHSQSEARLFQYRVSLASRPEALASVQATVKAGQNCHVITLNPEMIMQGLENPELDSILKEANLILPDGAGVVWALRQQGETLARLPGIEFADSLLKWACEERKTVALVGAKPETLTLAIQEVYHHHGFFQDEAESNTVAEACARENPALVLVALGVPRQEVWIKQHVSKFSGAVLMGIGGSLDVWSGKTRRAPALFRLLNLEWLYRITTEPWRLKRVYKTLPLFALKVLLQTGKK